MGPADEFLARIADNERRLYAQLAPLSITPISVSHHPALLAFRDPALALRGAGSGSLEPAATHRWDSTDA